MSLAHSPNAVTNGLIICLDAKNIKSYSGTGSVWTDISANGYSPTKTGSQAPTYPSWNSGGWFTFNGGATANPYGYFPIASIPTLSAITVTAWFRSTLAGTNVLRMSNDSFQIGGDGLCAGTTYNNIQIAGDRTSTLNTWVCDALTFSGTVLIGYRNGVQVGTNSRTSTTVGGGTLNIGTRNDGYAAHYVGDIAVVKIYNRVLSSDEILQNFNAYRGRFGI